MRSTGSSSHLPVFFKSAASVLVTASLIATTACAGNIVGDFDPGEDGPVDLGGSGDSADETGGSDAPGGSAGEDTGEGSGSGASGGDESTSPRWWQPGPGTSWQWQLSGNTIDRSIDVVMYDVDLESDKSVMDSLHDDGRIVICYFSAGSYEDYRTDSDDFPSATLGNILDGWEDERWLDIRSEAVRDIMRARLDVAVQKGCDGVEPDNVDGYSNDTGFDLSPQDQLDYNRFLASEAHARDLSIGLKNDLDQIPELVDDFDWALNEECFVYDECDLLTPFVQANKAVFQVEYGSNSLADEICDDANALDFDSLVKNLDLDPFRISCR